MKFNKIIIDSSDSITDLCNLGAKYPTDKSAYAEHNEHNGHRHAYMAIYDLLFAPLRHKKIKFAEGGIHKNNSIKCWREYFNYAEIFGFENDLENLNNAKNDNLENTKYLYMDVSDSNSIIDTLNNTGGDFDVIIDDMIHNVYHNALFAKEAYKYLKVGGYLIIEDICQKDNNHYGDNFDELYYEYLKDIIPYFSSITYIESRHKNLYSGDWDNDRLLVMVRNENK